MSFNLEDYLESNKMTGMSLDQYSYIFNYVKNKAPVNFLVFGLGLDSIIWNDHTNINGRTCFLEDVPDWINKVKSENPSLEAHFTQYTNSAKEADELLRAYQSGDTHCLRLDLPHTILNTNWDIILVDGPQGWHINNPGRMKSIFTAFDLQKNLKSGDIFVHDSTRYIEKLYCDFFLEPNYNLVNNIEFKGERHPDPNIISQDFVSLTHFQK